MLKTEQLQPGDKCFCGYQQAFLESQLVTFLFDCKLWKDDTAPRLK